MAKKNETAGKTAPVNNEVTTESVMDVIKQGNMMPENAAENVLAQIEKEEKEHKESQLKDRILRARFKNFKELLQLRARRREEKATKEALTATKTALDELCAGKLTVADYDKKAAKIEDAKRKAFSESSKQYEEEYCELKNVNPSFRCFCWWD